MPRGSFRCVAPTLVTRIAIVAERRERVAARAMKMDGVLLEPVIRRQVHAATEPPRCGRVRFGIDSGRVRGKTPHVEMHGGRIRVARMQDE